MQRDRREFETLKQAPKSGYTLVCVSQSWGGRVKNLKWRGWSETREGALAIQEARLKNTFGGAGDAISQWNVMSVPQIKKALKEIAEKTSERRKAGAEKAAKKAKNFILCPTCQAKSKKLYSEMGGLETRQCKNGHLFESDHKWGIPARRIENADRGFFVGPSLRYGRFQ